MGPLPLLCDSCCPPPPPSPAPSSTQSRSRTLSSTPKTSRQDEVPRSPPTIVCLLFFFSLLSHQPPTFRFPFSHPSSPFWSCRLSFDDDLNTGSIPVASLFLRICPGLGRPFLYPFSSISILSEPLRKILDFDRFRLDRFRLFFYLFSYPLLDSSLPLSFRIGLQPRYEHLNNRPSRFPSLTPPNHELLAWARLANFFTRSRNRDLVLSVRSLREKRRIIDPPAVSAASDSTRWQAVCALRDQMSLSFAWLMPYFY